uniref:Uncharacterized protein n=1 Tax=viral metagenome TaxID=1070528 RepID=A0A6C0FFC9_9ZZZZ|tara:strand:+ start:2652 stop:3098 length:447 start_codon:yes stop_codon:yes gene_type:complete
MCNYIKMGIKGTYFPLPTAYDTIESTYNSKINEAYYIIDNIKVNNIYQEDISDDMSGNEYTNLLIQLTVYNNYDERLNTTFETRNELEIIDFYLIIDNKSTSLDVLWDYCYNNVTPILRTFLEQRLLINYSHAVLNDEYKNGINLEKL